MPLTVFRFRITGTVVVVHQCAGLRGWRPFPSIADFQLFVFAAVGVSMASAGLTVEQTQSEQVDQEPRGTDPDDHFRALDLVGLGEAFDSFQDDGEAKRRKKDSVD